ncbi:hypothetical protein [Vibrio japonicus]|nr:hypothetical protein [Vibrio japonicus]
MLKSPLSLAISLNTMSKLKLSIALLIIAVCALFAYVFIPTHVRLGSEIINKPINDQYRLVGYKAISTEPKDGKLNHYFLLSTNQTTEGNEPFLISSDPFIKIIEIKDNKLTLSVKGRVKHFDNDLWVEKADGKVEHWLISANIRFVR